MLGLQARDGGVSAVCMLRKSADEARALRHVRELGTMAAECNYAQRTT